MQVDDGQYDQAAKKYEEEAIKRQNRVNQINQEMERVRGEFLLYQGRLLALKELHTIAFKGETMDQAKAGE